MNHKIGEQKQATTDNKEWSKSILTKLPSVSFSSVFVHFQLSVIGVVMTNGKSSRSKLAH